MSHNPPPDDPAAARTPEDDYAPSPTVADLGQPVPDVAPASDASRSSHSVPADPSAPTDWLSVPAGRSVAGEVSLPGDRPVSADPSSADLATPEAQRGGPLFGGVVRGPFQAGEWVSLHGGGKRRSVKLVPGATWHTTRGGISHDDIIGAPEGRVFTTTAGFPHIALRPLLDEYTVSMPRGATVVYPKDSGHILMQTDIFPGARVLEAGAGSGGLSLALLRQIGPGGRLYSYERRADFAAIASANVEHFFGGPHPAWRLIVGDLLQADDGPQVDRAVLDLLAPWECVATVHRRLIPGGWLCCYVATTTQLGRTMDTIRAHDGWMEPTAVEVNVRQWRAEGLAVRPGHAGRGHTGFIITARRLADGQAAPLKRRRPAPGAYGPDYTGPRPRGVEPAAPVEATADPVPQSDDADD